MPVAPSTLHWEGPTLLSASIVGFARLAACADVISGPDEARRRSRRISSVAALGIRRLGAYIGIFAGGNPSWRPCGLPTTLGLRRPFACAAVLSSRERTSGGGRGFPRAAKLAFGRLGAIVGIFAGRNGSW